MLYDYQLEALSKLRNGNILVGGVGSGKSRTGIAYYIRSIGGESEGICGVHEGRPVLYIITTARKRDDREWDLDLAAFGLFVGNGVVVDSWNNIRKYSNVTGGFFLFDEQRVVGSGTWVKSFLRISRRNRWILLTATPGDSWSDYIPVFVANGFYRNRTEFLQRHAVWNRYTKYPKIDRWIEEDRLRQLRDSITVHMNYRTKNHIHRQDVFVNYNEEFYKKVWKNRWNPYTSLPIENASELCYTARRIVNSDPSRISAVTEILEEHPMLIVFYNYDYELEDLKYFAERRAIEYAEYNGHVHQPVPNGNEWLYFVNYMAGAEAWNCITTDSMVFYSLSYSYKTMTQAAGRIDRNNTPFSDLYYFYLRSKAPIDLGISRTLKYKKDFNAKDFVGKW